MRLLFPKAEMPDPARTLPGRPAPDAQPGTHFVNGRPMGGPYPDGFEIADFAQGCYWGPERRFWQTAGVWVTAVGYQGGSTPNPTYAEACSGRTGHAETVRIVFDPTGVSYADLLRTFWENHDPTQGFRQGNDVGTQYRSAIFTHRPEQMAVALASRDAYQRELTQAGFGEITTEIIEAPDFFFAHDAHQQYLAKDPAGYCPDHGTGVSCPIGLGVGTTAGRLEQVQRAGTRSAS
jgi:peptide-methionine (S)-S-oxide reductase